MSEPTPKEIAHQIAFETWLTRSSDWSNRGSLIIDRDRLSGHITAALRAAEARGATEMRNKHIAELVAQVKFERDERTRLSETWLETTRLRDGFIAALQTDLAAAEARIAELERERDALLAALKERDVIHPDPVLWNRLTPSSQQP